MKTLALLSSMGIVLAASAETSVGDITAAVREAGLTPTCTMTVNGSVPYMDTAEHPAEVGVLFNGLWSQAAESEVTSGMGRIIINKNTGFPASYPLVITYDVPDAFCADAKVVLKGVSFRVGPANASGGAWGDYDTRVVSDVLVEGSNDGVLWGVLNRGAEDVIETESVGTPGETSYQFTDQKLTFADNVASYRHYRITVRKTKAPANSFPLQVSEVLLVGEYGDPIGNAVSCDLTAAVRNEGYAPTSSVTVNGTDVDAAYHTAFNGSWGYYEGSTWKWEQDRLLVAKSTGFPATYPLVITYDVPEAFHPGMDVVVTGVTFRLGAATKGPGDYWGSATNRLPVQVNVAGSPDGTHWEPIHRGVEDEMFYSETRWTDPRHPDKVGSYWYSDKCLVFPNDRSYRHYRISVINTGSPADDYPLQIGEVLLLGSYGTNIPKLPVKRTGDLTEALLEANLQPTVTATINGGPVQSSGTTPVEPSMYFDGVWTFHQRSTTTLSAQRDLISKDKNSFPATYPLVLTYDVPEGFRPDEAVVLKGISFVIGADSAGGKFGDYSTRLPSDVQIEGKNDGDWAVICRLGNAAFTQTDSNWQDASFTQFGNYRQTDRSASFDNWRSYRHYRITVLDTNAPNNSYPLQVGEVRLLCEYGGVEEKPDPVSGDITEAVRKAGFATTITSSHKSTLSAVETLVDGWWSSWADYAAGHTATQRYFVPINNAAEGESVTTANPVVLTMTIPDLFCPGDDVVVTGLTLVLGGSQMANQPDPETRNLWGNARDRVPTSWKLEGSADDGANWFTIAELKNDEYKSANYTIVQHTSSQTGEATDDYMFALDTFYNERSARKYRLTLTGSDSLNKHVNETAYQFCEIQLLGSYGGTYQPPAPQTEEIDVTAAVRAAGDRRTFGGNLAPWSVNWAIEKAFNGTVTGESDDRFISSEETSALRLTDAGACLDYILEDGFARNGDVVATGYRMEAASSHNYAKDRLPCSWEFLGSNDGVTWTLLDKYENFFLWNLETIDGVERYGFTFHFANRQAFRRYRIKVTKLCGEVLNETFAESDKLIQFSEFTILGFVGPRATEEVVVKTDEHPIDNLTQWGSSKTFLGALNYFKPVVTAEQADKWSIACTNMFDFDERNRGLAQDITLPLAFTYEVPADFLGGKDLVITNYELMVRQNYANSDVRRPLSWRFEGWDEAGARWVKLDVRTNFTDWEEGESMVYTETESKKTWYKSFPTARSNGYAFRKYRFVITALNGTVSGSNEFQLSQIYMRGKWGTLIGAPLPERKGLLLQVR